MNTYNPKIKDDVFSRPSLGNVLQVLLAEKLCGNQENHKLLGQLRPDAFMAVLYEK